MHCETISWNDKQKDLENVNNKMHATFKAFATENMGCIVYIFDRSEDGGGIGFNTKNCDCGDALVALKRIMERFGIEPNLLVKAMEVEK